MTALQHIVASKASPICNNMPLPATIAWGHNAYMDETDSNGGPNHLRAWREYRKLSQQELADKIGTSHQIIGYLERGRTQLSAKWLRKLAPALDTTPGMMLDHAPDDLGADIIDIWTHASKRERKQITDVAMAIVRTGTHDD